MGKHCLVTGCAGFVGSHLTEALLAQGCKVVGLDNLSSGKLENMAGFMGDARFCFVRGGIEDAESLLAEAFPHGMHACFHLAAQVSVPYSVEHPEETMRTNHRCSVALLGWAEFLGAASFVFAGSAAEYGDAVSLPLKESDAEGARRLSPYGESKYLAGKAVEASPIGCSLRCFNIYGPRQDPSSPYSGVISRFMAQADEGLALTVQGEGSQTRDFIAVADVVQAYLMAAGFTASPGVPLKGIYNVGTGRPTSILDLARIIIELTANQAGLTHTPARAGDIAHSLADVSRLAVLGFSARLTLAQGLSAMLAVGAREKGTQAQ